MKTLRQEEKAMPARAAVDFKATGVPRLGEPKVGYGFWRGQKVWSGSEIRHRSRLVMALLPCLATIMFGFIVVPSNVGTPGFIVTAVLTLALVSWLADRSDLGGPAPLAETAPGEYRVLLVLRRRGRAYAEDEGTVTFSDGYFFFEGATTTFSFSRHAVRRSMHLPWLRYLDFGPGESCQLTFRMNEVDYNLSLKCEASGQLRRSFRGFMNSLVNVEEEILPPTTANVSGLRLAQDDARLALVRIGTVLAMGAVAAGSMICLDPFSGAPIFQFDPAQYSSSLFIFGASSALLVFVFAVALPWIRAKGLVRVLKRELAEDAGD